ncbi:MAG TPA: SAM-dependent methyltransferase [Chloroflexota bacterium]|nr:SAM-dependent methyltransferase [Chloroflexota bacterium]
MVTRSPAPDLALAFCSVQYEDAAINELAMLLGARLNRRLAPGVLLLRTPHSPAESCARIEAAPPIFTRQLGLGVARVEVSGQPGSIAVADEGRDLVVHDLEGRPVSGGPSAALVDAAHALPLLGEPDPLPIAAVTAGNDTYVGRVLAGAGLPAPFWPAGKPRLPYRSDLVSRSALKLLEGLAVFAVHPTPGGRALDLGAAPGGWTQVLAGLGLAVAAVDPGALAPQVAALPEVTALQMTAESYLARAHSLMDAESTFALVVNDMRLDARESARLMVRMAPFLSPRGAAFITLKLPHGAPTAILRQAMTILSDGFPVVRARCLWFNRSEVTVYIKSVF